MPGPYIVDYGDKLWNDLLTHIDELDGSELHGLAANAGVLYLMRLVGCDVIFTLLERDRSLFSTLFEVVVDMASRLVCMEDRYRIFEKYVKTKSKYTTELLELLNIACRGKEIDVANGHAENCGKWIETNLEKFVKNK
ncbi:uncharacterized protein LOC132703914 [Cylas formicarius]|uniref:uncharacterized protein LOC132703914 n=1 Tax=Cylas formicarius TaxID=197179 RepID=UPI00295879E1|nr:uncharacterized protein LOC132703914 [Cylas formicarius]XP_060529426.1 uncharacterized protein LOC132703914 [Cylas formicarius]